MLFVCGKNEDYLELRCNLLKCFLESEFDAMPVAKVAETLGEQ